jgi:PAS domain S-box-containing protein
MIALVAVVAAAGLRFALDPLLGDAHPFPLFLGAVIVVAWFGGALPAVAAALAGYLMAEYFFVEPRGAFEMTPAMLAGLGVYLVSSALIAGLGGAMHSARRRAESSEEGFRRFMENSPAAVSIEDEAGQAVYRNPAARALAAPEAGERKLHTARFPLPEADGRSLTGSVSIDVTEQARTAEELRLVTDTMSAGVVRVSSDLNYVWVNRVFASWHGKAPNEIIGRSLEQVLGARDWQEVRPHVERALNGERVEYERLVRFAGGEERWIHSVIEPTRDASGTPNGLVAVASDIHARKEAEAAVNSAREQLQLVADSMPAAVALCSRDLRYAWINSSYADRLGKAPADVIGRPIAEVLGADDFALIRPYVERVLAGESLEYERLARHARLGERRWMRVVFSPTRDGCAWIAVTSDIHDRKLMEETLRQAERRKDEFLATLAHELRNPLAPIRNAVAILAKKHALDPELAWSREVIERQVEQMSRLIDDLLDIARIAGGKLLVRKERVPLERAIDMALETSRPHINAAGHRLSVLLPSERITVEADPARLAQVFSNLLNNAARYTEGRGEITLAAEVEAGEVIVSVQDNGIGFAPEVAGRLFEPFAQLTRSNERAHGGLGIGLSLVQGIVALHGGKVQARSRGLGQGAEFIVRLPLPRRTDRVAEAKPEAQARERLPAQGVKILVADDNRDAADSLQRILSLYGYEVQVAYDGAAAIQLDGRFRPRVAVLDIGMPGANGFEVARSIRGSRGDRVTLIALTGWGQEGDRRRAMEAGFDYHLTKPVDPGALNDLLVEVAAK